MRQILTDLFDETDLHNLCFDMNIDYESLPGIGKANKARELVAYCQRCDRYNELRERCQKLRPNAFQEARDSHIHESLSPQQRYLHVYENTQSQHHLNISGSRIVKTLKTLVILISFIALANLIASSAQFWLPILMETIGFPKLSIHISYYLVIFIQLLTYSVVVVLLVLHFRRYGRKRVSTSSGTRAHQRNTSSDESRSSKVTKYKVKANTIGSVGDNNTVIMSIDNTSLEDKNHE